MKKTFALILAIIICLSYFPVAVSAAGEEYTFTLIPSQNNVSEGQTFTVSLEVTGSRFNAYSAKIGFDGSVLECLDSDAVVSGNYIYIKGAGKTLYESGTTLSVITFGVKDISSTKRPKIWIESAHADTSGNSLVSDAKNAVTCDPVTITCSAVNNPVPVRFSINKKCEDNTDADNAGRAFIRINGTDQISGTVSRGSTYVLEAVPNEGYSFKGWSFYNSDDIRSTDTAYSYTFDYDTDVTAVFMPAVYDVNLDKVGIKFSYSRDMLPVEGYAASLTNLQLSDQLTYHLYKGKRTLPEDEIPMWAETFYLPDNTDVLTLTCSYKSGEETVELSREITVNSGTLLSDAVSRTLLPKVSNNPNSTFVTNASIDINSAAPYIDPATQVLTLFAAGSYVDGAVMTDPASSMGWVVAPVRSDGFSHSTAYVSKVSGNVSGTLVWYNGKSPVNVYRYTGNTWEKMTALDTMIENRVAGNDGDLEIYPLSSENDMFIQARGNLFHYDGTTLESIGYYDPPISCYRIDDHRVLISQHNGGSLYVYDSTAGDISLALPVSGTVLGTDFVNGESNVVFVRSSDSYVMYDIDNRRSTSIDVTGLLAFNFSAAVALNRAVDGDIYALIPGPGNPGHWLDPTTGFTGAATINYIWKTGDYGVNWTLVDSGNAYAYDRETAASLPGNDETPNTPDPTLWSDGFDRILNPVKGVTLFTGLDGAMCVLLADSTITFDSMGGSGVEAITQTIRSEVSAPASPSYGDKIFAGWYLDPECSDDKLYNFSLMPGKDITLYAKWSDSAEDLAAAKQAAIEELGKAYDSYDQNDYPEDGWTVLTREYNSGKAAINAAGTYDAIQQALIQAKEKMAAVEKSGTIQIAVTVETLTVNGKYIVEPVLVEADSYEKASVVLTEILKEHYSGVYSGTPYRNSGSVQSGFYLQSVYDPEFGPDPVKGFVQTYAGFLSELDCGEQSGWMYCINGTFPGVGSDAWNLKNGDVMRWQYTCSGLGADIGSDNSAWGSGFGVKVADKDALIWRVAEINQDKEDFFAEKETNEAAYDNAMEVLKDITATQEQVDAALEALGGKAETAEEKLQKAKDAAIAALNAYDPDDYRQEEKALLEQYVSDGISAVNAAATPDEVSEALSDALAKIGALITDSQYDAIEDVSSADIDKIYADTGAYMAGLGTPNPGSIGGEWMTIGLVRAGYDVPDEWATQYYANAQNYVTASADENGKLDQSKSTENARMILALTSIGKDPRNVGGKDLTAPLADLEYLKKQGINGPIWALIAFDSHDYEIPEVTTGGTQVTRDLLIDTILAAQKDDGGWNLSDSASFSDTDMTAMAIQALAPYYDSDPEVRAAVDRALAMLSNSQNGIGGYSSWGVANSESVAQVITALTSLGIDPTRDARFIKNGHTLIDNLATYAEEGGGFRHTQDASLDGMATEQGYYSLASWYRLKEGKTSLYDMSDVELDTACENVEKLIDAIDEPVTLEDEAEIKAARDAYEALSDEQKTHVDSEMLEKLEEAEKALSDLKVARAEELINAIGSPVRLSDENAIASARNWYNKKLSDDEKARVTNYDKLTAAEAALQKLKRETPTGETKAVTVTIDGVTYEVSQATKDAVEAMQAITDPADPADRLPEDFRDLTPEKEQQILDAYMLYQALSPDEKLFATNYESFYEDVLLKLGRNYHYDERTKTDARNNDDDVLPWYVKLEVSDDEFSEEELERIAEALGEDFNLEKLYRISFTDVFTGEPFAANEPVNVRFPLYETQGRRTYAFVYEREDGSLEFIEGRVVDGELVMDRADFGRYGLADSSLTWEEIVSGRMPQKSSYSWIWLAVSGAALIGLIIFFIIWKRRKDDEEEEQA